MSSDESVKDDILKQLANQIKALQLKQVDATESHNAVITSNNIHLKCLFDLLDHILVFGLKNPNNGYWDFVCEFTHPEVKKQVNEYQDVHSVCDKGRLWIYLALLDCLLGSYFRMFYENQKIPTKYYNRNAFIRDKERLAVIFTLVAGLDFIKLSSELDFSFLGFGLTNVLGLNSKTTQYNEENTIPMSPFYSEQTQLTTNGHIHSSDSHLNGNTYPDQKEERTGFQDKRTVIHDKISPTNGRENSNIERPGSCDDVHQDSTDGSFKMPSAEVSYLDSVDWLSIKSPQMTEQGTADYEPLSDAGDSFDEFCHNNDRKSIDSNEIIDNSTISIIEADEEDGQPSEQPSISVSEVSSVADYEGIVLAGLPRRPGLSETLGTSADVSLKKLTIEELSLNVFLDQSEIVHRTVKVFTGFKYGQLHCIYLLFTDKAMYFLRRQNYGSLSCEKIVPFDDVKQIEIGLNCQSLAFVAEDENFCLSTGNESVTRSLISDISSLVVKNLPSPSQLTRLVASAAVQGEAAIKKWLRHSVKNQALNLEVLCFSLIHWICFSGPGSELDTVHYEIIKEGHLDCKSRYLGMVSHWERNYLVLTPKGLYQYNRQGDKNPKFVYNLEMNCGGCRRVSDQEKKFAFEIISDDGSVVIILSSSSEDRASDWILKLCQTVSGSTEFLSTPPSKTLPCCLVVTKQDVITFHAHTNGEYRFLSSFLIQDITQILVDNEVRQYCILKFESDHEGMWLFSFTTEYELGKFEQAIAEAWKDILQADLQFYIIGEGPCRKRARDMCRYIQTTLIDS